MDDRSVYAEGTHVYPVAITLKVTVGGFLSGVCISQRGHVNSNAITTVPAGFSASFIFYFCSGFTRFEVPLPLPLCFSTYH